MSSLDIRNELCKYARKIVDHGLVVGPGGNISARLENSMFLSPSGFALEEIEPEQWIEVDIPSGEISDTKLRPSSEVLMHLYGYRQKPDMGAMIHTHPPYCIAFTLVEQNLPIMFPDQAALVGKTLYIPYLIPTTDLLANAVADKVTEASSILLGNHGLVTTGRNLREAFYRTQVVEESAKIYLSARAVGNPVVLTDQEFADIAALESEDYRIKLLQQMK
ncbi:L-fuculose-phosphate aldolase [Paenibacillus sp. DS2015]|uniref:class II aldolase/adducin family protein n=1 Tax=Paenibacillus sp. DS2015 TaxID=3373917 RepID=UPI003D1D52D6